MSEYTNYLSRLKFDSSLGNSIQAKYLTNFRLVLMLIVAIVGIGWINYRAIPRRLNPEIQIPIVTISTVLPGANPTDIEQLVTTPLEDELKSVKNVDILTSSSRDNVSIIVMQFLSTVSAADARTEVQQAVDTVTDLPEDAKTPVVDTVDFENQPVWTFALLSSDPPSLMRGTKILKTELENVAKIDRVATSGDEQELITILIDPTKLSEYGLNPLQLSQSIRAAATSLPAGSLQTDQSTFALSIDPSITRIEDIRNIRISPPGGAVVRLGDIAAVQERAPGNKPVTLYADTKTKPKQSVQFFVYKSKTANIDESAKAAKEIVENFLSQNENRFQIVTIENTGTLIEDQFTDLISEFQSTVILIFIILTLFLGLKQAIIASFTVPLTLLSGVAIANMLGLTLNFLTLFAFLIALGLLVDDTIVVVTAMTRYYASGKFTPAQTGILVWKDFIVPIWSTTITTIWSFIPLLLATGIIGEFIKPIPIIVTATMMSSTSIAVLITIPLMIIFLKPSFPRRVRILLIVIGLLLVGFVSFFLLPPSPLTLPIITLIFLLIWLVYKKYNPIKVQSASLINKYPHTHKVIQKIKEITQNGYINTEYLSNTYMRLIRAVLISPRARRNKLIFLVVFALASYALVPLGFVKNEFFPKTDEDTIYVSLELPSGSTLNSSYRQGINLMNKLRKTTSVQYVIAETGSALNADFQRDNSPNNTLFTLHVGKADERDASSIDIAQSLRDNFAHYEGGAVTVIERSGGPPAGADIQIKLLGDDLATLSTYAEKIKNYLRNQPGVTNIQTSVKTGTSKIVFVPDDTKLAVEGISRNDIGFWLRTYASGFTLDALRLTDNPTEKIDVNFQLTSTTGSPDELANLNIQKPDGTLIPLVALGELRLKNNPTVINHEDTKRTLSVTASVSKGFAVSDINTKLESFATNELALPRGYSWKTGGVNEENQKSVNSILQAMLVSFLLILVTMIIEFHSYRQAAIVMLTIPLAVSGVFYVFGLTGTPLSFPALIGILALFGIVVTNAIVVVEKINSNLREGMEMVDAIVDASGSRLEPVLLTSLATIFGLLPITIADPLWRGLGGAIIAGLFFSGTIKLVFIPIMYYSWLGEEKLKKS